MKVTHILIVIFSLVLSSNLVASEDDILPQLDFDEVYGSSIGIDHLKYAYDGGAYGHMSELFFNRARAEAWIYLNNDKKYSKLMVRIFKELEKLINDDSLSESQKGNKLIELAEIDMSTFQTLSSGELGGQGQYSIKYDIAKLEWDKKIHIGECPGIVVGQQCGCSGIGPEKEWVCKSTTEIWIDYIRQTPSFEVYRVVDGRESLITKIDGSLDVSRQSLSFSADIWSTVKSIYEFELDPLKTDSTKAIFYDFSADYREPGQSLSYRVYADRAPYRFGTKKCGSSSNFESSVSFDADGDAQIDFIPDSKYSEMLGEMYGFIAPVIAPIL